MTTHTIALVAAGAGVLFSVAYVVLGARGLRTLRQIRPRLDRDRT